jgi:hypothetical protein
VETLKLRLTVTENGYSLAVNRTSNKQIEKAVDKIKSFSIFLRNVLFKAQAFIHKGWKNCIVM